MKLDGTLAIASLIELKREGYKPRRSIVLEFSGDEETNMKTSGIIADTLANAELVLNIDGAGRGADHSTSRRNPMISKFFIERPVLANVLAILVVIGAVALFALPVAQYPDVVPPTVRLPPVIPAPAPPRC